MLRLGLVLLLSFLPQAEPICAGLESAFDILPVGDHYVEYGNSLELFCKLNTSYEHATGRNSSDLAFYSSEPNSWAPYETHSVVNETTIKLLLEKPPLGSRYYYCSFNKTSSCLTNVQVGFKPQPVDNFECKSWNWEKLNCTWTPKYNSIKTFYKLKLALAGRAGRTPLLCPNHLDVRNNTCIFTLHTDPTYRQPHEYFTFELTGENALGNNTSSYKFHHYAHVIPEKPTHLVLVNKTINSAVIKWEIPYPVYNFPPGLQFKIEYKSKWDPLNVWNKIEPKNDRDQPVKINKRSHTFNITGLKYAYTIYDVRVYLKSYAAKAGPEDWSEPATFTFVTLPKRPSLPPKTTFGSFDIVSRGNDTDIFIYWNRINESLQNGAEFRYEVICVKGDAEACGPPTEKTLSYAKFPYDKHKEYKFSIFSANEVDQSLESSHVFVPRFESVSQPEGFTKVAYNGGDNSSETIRYELSWKPVRDKYLSNYTLFWCEDDRDLPVPCKGIIDWIHVEKDSTRKNITMRDVKKFYKFAIAANLENGQSSGMIWSSCVIFHDKILKKVDDVKVINLGSRQADVTWEVRCAQSSTLKGFVIYYCPIAAPKNTTCKGNVTQLEISNGEQRNVTVKNLKPYTTYKLQVSIVSIDARSQTQVGPRSIAKEFSTFEDAPSEPLELIAQEVTNNSALLIWKLPREMNGILQTYKVRVNGVVRDTLEAKKSADEFVDRYLLTNLESYTKYNVSLSACVKECSAFSIPVLFETLVGSPGNLSQPRVVKMTNTSAQLEWKKPDFPGGKLDFYQVSFKQGEKPQKILPFNLSGTSGTVSIPDCKPNKRTEFRIRAINIDEKGSPLYGPWSEATSVLCGSSDWTEGQVVMFWVFGVGSFFALITFVYFIIKKGWLQCRKMKDVEVKLPPGLQSQDLEKDNQDYVHLDRWPPRPPDAASGNVGNPVPPDEESLLDKKSDESLDMTPFNVPVKNGGDSSGCSVGRESVSSSVTSDTRISSDSGAEADRCVPSSNDGSFGRWNSSGKKRSKERSDPSRKGRHGRNGVDPGVVDDPDFGNSIGNWQTGESAALGYTRVGFTDHGSPEKCLPGKGYVTIASVTSVNPPQKTNGELSYDTLPTEDFSRYYEDRSAVLDFAGDVAPRYVALARLGNDQVLSSPGKDGTSRSANASPDAEGSTEREDEASGDSVRDESSGNETETETVQNVPVIKNFTPMPPYVSMIENPGLSSHRREEISTALSSSVLDPSDKKPVIGIDDGRPEKSSKDSDSFPNYIPHRIFEKESVHT